MEKLSDAKVAMLAKQASDNFSVMAVVDMKTAFTFRLVSAANSTASILCCEHLGEFAAFKAVAFFKSVFVPAIWVCTSATFLVFSHLWQILSTPDVIAHGIARLAVHLKTMHGVLAFVKFRQQFGFSAFGAFFRAAREIEGFSAHSCFSYAGVSSIETTIRQ